MSAKIDFTEANSTAAPVDLNAALDVAVNLGIGEAFKGNTLVVDVQNDVDFNKPAAQLTKKITQGPFYAVKLYPESHISMGGPVSDATGRVLNEEGRIIPHLYAIGELSNREFYNVNYVGAASLAPYPAFGQIADLDAAKDARYNK
jgi:succinate dehydrogenase/fumarate reductase flavoprotein subunit